MRRSNQEEDLYSTVFQRSQVYDWKRQTGSKSMSGLGRYSDEVSKSATNKQHTVSDQVSSMQCTYYAPR